MSRPFRIVLPGIYLIAGLALSSCVGTIYDRTYSYHKNYFKPPKEKSTVSADAILGPVDKKMDPNALLDSAPPGGQPPAPDVPGLPPPGGLPDPNAAPPGMAAPGAPAAPGIPGVPAAPGTPPATPPPGTAPPPK
jgi:hypothetical protein